MSLFSARLQVPGQTRVPVGVEVDISDERMTLRVGNRPIADWPLDEVVVEAQTDGFHVKSDDEEIILKPVDPKLFASELGVSVDDESVRRGASRRADSESFNLTSLSGFQLEDFNSRISELAEILASNAVSPSEAFRRWLRLLKEVNHRHGSGSVPTHIFYDLNTRLLDLIPEPPASGDGHRF